jgi:nitrite reductase/ring-hydroxylating ferredoxin subunit
MAWQRALDESALEPGGHRLVTLEGQPILLARLQDGWHAVHDTCLHRGASLSVLPLDGEEAVCHLHLWRFSVRSGECSQVPSIVLRRFAVKVEQGGVYVDV